MLRLGKKSVVSNGNEVYIIAEIGQNHQGNLDTAKKMILEAKKIGCDCVKFQKSCLPSKFTKAALTRPYISANSWGSTYGEHKLYLEFDENQYRELQTYAQQVEMDFTASAMDEISLNFLSSMDVPFIKIGSGDANNVLLLRKAAKLNIPLVISTGMQTTETIENIVKIMASNNKTDYSLMHCVSSYPTDQEDCSLQIITNLKTKYPNVVIGYSGHEEGSEITKAAVLLGARIIERHFTMDHNQKGSDHKCSLEPYEFTNLVKDIRRIQNLGTLTKDQILNTLNSKEIGIALKDVPFRAILQSELKCKLKLGKSIVAAKHLKAGDVLSLSDLCIKVSEPSGISPEHFDSLLGKKLVADVEDDMPLMFIHICE